MKIEKAGGKDLSEISGLVSKEFPYVQRNGDELRQKIASGAIEILKAVEGKRLLGFVEIEFLEADIARINGMSVKEDARRKGVGKALLKAAKERLKKRGMKRTLLLVKQANKNAKELYENEGFSFIGLYRRKIDNAVVEEMELDLQQESPDYVS